MFDHCKLQFLDVLGNVLKMKNANTGEYNGIG